MEAIDRMRLRQKGSFYFALGIAGWNGTAPPKVAFSDQQSGACAAAE